MGHGGFDRTLRKRFAKLLRRIADALDSAEQPCAQRLQLAPSTVQPSCQIVQLTCHPVPKDKPAVSGPVSMSEPECDAYVAAFLDWVIDRGHVGEHDREAVEELTREFDAFAHTPGIQSNPLFRALSRAGVKHRMVDLRRRDPRYLAKAAKGVVRPRVRKYLLPVQVPCLANTYVELDQNLLAA